MSLDRIINVSSARGESQADILRRTGQYGVLPGDTDAQAMAKLNAVAIIASATAEAAAGPTYASTAAGLAATASGEGFAVDNGDGTVTVYLNNAGVAVAQRTLATTAALAASGGSALVGFLQSGIGASSRTAQSKLRETVSVKDFGAVGDGVTDDTAAFNAALTAASSVYVPSGDYVATSPIQVPSDKSLYGAGPSSRIVALGVTGPAIKIGTGSNPLPYRASVYGLTISGTATAGLEVNFADSVLVYRISLRGLTASRGFVFKKTWGGSYCDLSTAGAIISGECFAVGQDFNANNCSNWYTSNFCAVNVLLDGYLDGGTGHSHGSNFQNITVQGGNIGLYVRQYQGAAFDTVYEENTAQPVRLGDKTALALALAINIRNLNTVGPYSSHPNIASRGAVIFFSYAEACRIENPYLGAAFNLANVIPVTITGDGTGASAVAIANHSGAIVGVQVVRQGSGYTTATVSFGGSGSGAAATATLAAGAISSVTMASGGSGYVGNSGCLAAYRYNTAGRCVVDTPYMPAATNLNTPTWPWLVREAGALSNSGVIIRNDMSGQEWENNADLLKNRQYSYAQVLVEISAAPAMVLRTIIPIQL